MRKERRGNTDVLKKFIMKSGLLQVALNLIANSSEVKVDNLTRLMAVKFVKGLYMTEITKQVSIHHQLHS
jgi:hypothetical protein